MYSANEAHALEDTTEIRKRFRILMEIGRGGMATVFLAERISFDVRKLVVLKVLNGELAAHAEMRSAFRREAHLSARMNHPNVVQVFEVVEQTGQTIIVMEFLDGLPLSRVLRQCGLPLALHLDILTQVLDGLHHFHELTDVDGSPLNAVHRDVSPQNVLVLHDGVSKVLDFGVAKFTAADADHTRTGLIKGKIHYMPPEQLLSGAEVDRRADIFALGVMMWEALGQRRLWQGMKEGEVVRALARGEIPRIRDAVADVQPELEAIVNQALEPDPARRFATALDMKCALELALPGTVGVTHSRDLSAFMRENFAEARKQQRDKLDAARRDHSGELVLDASRVSWLPTPHPEGTIPDGAPGFAPSTPAPAVDTQAEAAARMPSLTPTPSRFRGVVALFFVALGVAGAGFGLSQARSVPPPPVREAGPGSVQLHVLADPQAAEIVIDGTVLGTGRYEGSHRISKDEHRLLVRAPGFVPKEEVLRLDKDVVRLIRLEAIPSQTSVPSSAPEVVSAPDEIATASTGRSRSASRSASSADATDPPLDIAAAVAPVPDSSASAAAQPATAVAAAIAPSAVTPPPAPLPSAPVRARQVTPKVGQAQLAVNISNDPYRVRLPGGLNRVAGTLETLVRICVDTSGSVSGVTVVRSADPALDRQLTSTIPRWRYRPLQDGGNAIPFCYSMQMRFVAGN